MEDRIGQQAAKIGFGKAMKLKWIKKEDEFFVRVEENPVDEDKTHLQNFISYPDVDSHDKKLVEEFKRRKHLCIKSIKNYKVTKGPNFQVQREKFETELTSEMLRSG